MVALGAPGDASAASGAAGDPADRSAPGAGAAFLFGRAGAAWTEIGYLKATNTHAGDGLGYGVAISADAATIALGAPHEASAATGIDPASTAARAESSGAVYVYR
jgi:hypothetical protein